MKRSMAVRACAICAVVALACGGQGGDGGSGGGIGPGLLPSFDGGTVGARPDVVGIGDSIFALSGDIEKSLYALSGETFKSYAVSGSEMTGGFVTTVPQQWANAKSQATPAGIKTVIMNGGGNDVLVSGQLQCSGSTVSATCKQLLQDEVWGPMKKMIDDMKSFGVDHIIYVGYYVTGDTDKEVVNRWSQEQMEAKCEAWEAEGGYGLKYIATQPTFEGKDPATYTKDDGLHPTAATSQIIAELIWDYMRTIDY